MSVRAMAWRRYLFCSAQVHLKRRGKASVKSTMYDASRKAALPFLALLRLVLGGLMCIAASREP